MPTAQISVNPGIIKRKKGMLLRFDKYVLERTAMLFSLFAFIALGIVWINRVVRELDRLAEELHSWELLLQYVAFMLPLSFPMVISVTALFTAIYLMDQMLARREIMIFTSAGMTPARLARPFAIFGLCCFLATSATVHFLEPLSRTKLMEIGNLIRTQSFRIRLPERQFLHPIDEVVVFIGSSQGNESLGDLIIHDSRDPDGARVIYTELARFTEIDGIPKLRLENGRILSFDSHTGELALLDFTELLYELNGLDPGQSASTPAAKHHSTRVLVRQLRESEGSERDELQLEVLDRMAEPVLSLVLPLIGFGSMILGSQLGASRIRSSIGAMLLIVVLYVVDEFLKSLAESAASMHYLFFAGPALWLAVAITLIWLASDRTRLQEGLRARGGSR